MMSRQDDARVAEIMGLGKARGNDQEGVYTLVMEHTHFPYELPYFTTDAGDDYKVLEWVRELDPGEAKGTWIFEYRELMKARKERIIDMYYLIDYQPGDYSRALLALRDRGLL